ncbi:MAG: hypothetical protein K0R51_3316 [Cytophagaceae bacterium]|jgi:hypothetical protein|nr:hypothetical protein [Cytophagaceae bacterium]
MKLMLFLIILSVCYIFASILSIRWIRRQSIMDNFQKSTHILLVLLLPLLWIYLLRMIYKPIPGYTKIRWRDSGTDGDSGGLDYFSSSGDGGGGGDGGSDGD